MLVRYIFFSIYFLSAFFCVLRATKIYDVFCNHYTLVNAWWIITQGYLLFFKDNSELVSDSFFYVCYTGLLFFNATVLFLKPLPVQSERTDKLYINTTFRRIIELLLFLILLPSVIENITVLKSGVEAYVINMDYWDSKKTSTYAYNVLFEYFVYPGVRVLAITAYYRYHTNTSKISDRLNLLMSLLLSGMVSISMGGGREMLMFWFFTYIFAVLLSRHSLWKENFNANAKLSLPLVCGVFLLLVGFSIIRGYNKNPFIVILDSYTIYPYLFDYYLTKTDVFSFYQLGTGTFESVVLLFLFPFKMLFNIDLTRINSITQEFVELDAFNSPTNSHVSMFFRFMFDWGYAGIIVGPIILAIFFHLSFKFSQRNGMYSCLYLLVLAYTNTCLECKYSTLHYLLPLLYLVIWKAACKKDIEYTYQLGKS